MRADARIAIVSRLADYAHAVEVGIGTRTDVADGLADRGVSVTAMDVQKRSVPAGVTFVRDDLTDPTLARYPETSIVYGCNLPPELHRSAREFARRLDADLAFTTLGMDPPTIDIRPETLPGTTLYWATSPGCSDR
ncbi:MAG: UPF0146 family protein [Halobacteriales archaeon]